MHIDHLASILLVYVLHMHSDLINTTVLTLNIDIASRMFTIALMSTSLSSSAGRFLCSEWMQRFTEHQETHYAPIDSTTLELDAAGLTPWTSRVHALWPSLTRLQTEGDYAPGDIATDTRRATGTCHEAFCYTRSCSHSIVSGITSRSYIGQSVCCSSGFPRV